MSAGEIDRVERELLAADGASLSAIARRIREQIDDVAPAAVLRYRDEIIDYATGVTLHDDYAVVVARPEETHTEHVLRSSPYADRLLTDALGPLRAYDDAAAASWSRRCGCTSRRSQRPRRPAAADARDKARGLRPARVARAGRRSREACLALGRPLVAGEQV